MNPCPYCGATNVVPDTTCPRSVDCPTCKGKAGGPCYRPSGHKAMTIHAERIETAEKLDRDRGLLAQDRYWQKDRDGT